MKIDALRPIRIEIGMVFVHAQFVVTFLKFRWCSLTEEHDLSLKKMKFDVTGMDTPECLALVFGAPYQSFQISRISHPPLAVGIWQQSKGLPTSEPTASCAVYLNGKCQRLSLLVIPGFSLLRNNDPGQGYTFTRVIIPLTVEVETQGPAPAEKITIRLRIRDKKRIKISTSLPKQLFPAKSTAHSRSPSTESVLRAIMSVLQT